MANKTMVSEELLEELELIILEEYGIKLDKSELSEFGNTILGFFELLITIDQPKYGTNR